MQDPLPQSAAATDSRLEFGVGAEAAAGCGPPGPVRFEARLFGYQRPTSPHLDRFAEGATVYEAAISQSSWTQPATATLLTGLYPVEHGVLGGVRLDPSIETLPEMLQGAGFTTFALSANPVIGRGSGYHAGSETFMQVPFARADAVRDGFESWLDEQQGRRWFAYLHFMDPHEPYAAPPPFAGSFTRGYEGPLRDPARWAELLERVNFRSQPAGINAADLRYLIGAYDEEIRSWDEASWIGTMRRTSSTSPRTPGSCTSSRRSIRLGRTTIAPACGSGSSAAPCAASSRSTPTSWTG